MALDAEQCWRRFCCTGSVEDYLAYRQAVGIFNIVPDRHATAVGKEVTRDAAESRGSGDTGAQA